MSEDLQGFILHSNYWTTRERLREPPIVAYQRRCRCWGKKDGWIYYDVEIVSQGIIRTFYRVRTFIDRGTSQKTNLRMVEYAKTPEDCPDERRHPPSYRVKPDRINLKYHYKEQERSNELILKVVLSN